MARQLKITVNYGWAGCEEEDLVDLPDNWDTMTEDQRDDFATECAETTIWNRVEHSYEIVEEGEA